LSQTYFHNITKQLSLLIQGWSPPGCTFILRCQC